MSSNLRNVIVVLVLAIVAVTAAADPVPQTLLFREGYDYTGTVSLIISDNPTYDPVNPVGPPPAVNGATGPRLQVDAAATDTSGVQTSWRRDVLLRFDNIFGDQPSQIPLGVTILSARLELYTADVANAQSPGPIGIARLLRPFDLATTTFTDPFGSNGPDWAGGDFDHWVGGYEGCPRNAAQIAEVGPIVQAWADGQPNYGFILRIVPSNAWIFCGQANGTVARRPTLTVDFVRVRPRQVVFQQGVNEYAGSSMLRLQAPTTTNPAAITTLGTAIPDAAFLDGGDNLSYGLLKFEDVFGAGPNQVSPTVTILKAYVALSTTGNTNAPSRGRYDFHRLLLDVDWAGDGGEPFLWTDFLNADGPTEADGEIGPTLASAEGILWNSRPWVDITDTVKEWQSGSPNYGLVVSPGTSDNPDGVTAPGPVGDGWEIGWLGANVDLHPQLIVVVRVARADLTGDGYVDNADLTLFETCASGPGVPYVGGCSFADLDNDADVDQVDFGLLQTCYSGTQLARTECR